MPRKIRDLVVTLAAMVVLFMMLMSISPQLRERVGLLNGGVSGQNLDASRSAVSHTVTSVSTVVSGYSSENPYQVGFVVAACVLFVLMLRT